MELHGVLRAASRGTPPVNSRLVLRPARGAQLVIEDAFCDAARPLPQADIVRVATRQWVEPDTYTIVWEVAGCESPPIVLAVEDTSVNAPATALSLEVIPEPLGVAGEPVLVLRIENAGPDALDAAAIIDASSIANDRARSHYIRRTWDGAFEVPGGRAAAWLLARNDFEPELTPGRVHIESCGLASNAVVLT